MTAALTGEVRATIERRYGVRLGGAAAINGGEESDVWRVESDRGSLAVVISSPWRTVGEMEWVHELTTVVAAEIPEVVVAIPAPDDATLIQLHGRLLAVYPWVDGDVLNREDPYLREEAARLLARLHVVMMNLPLEQRPEPGPDAPVRWPTPMDPPEMIDSELDTLLREVDTGKRSLARGAIHGDYYGRNVLCQGGRIAGVVDWNESAIAFPMQELAWSTWEFAHSGMGDRLNVDHARSFIRAYESQAGGCLDVTWDMIVPFIRRRLRHEVRLALAAAQCGGFWHREYMEAEIRAFQWLRDFPAEELR